ncbi:Ribosomal RNA small subunit methyltransferase E [Gluconacetobacter sp. SXCC-1]|uniref:Ribosomal RNA small subunit methyltransferase E n=1 Tax=Komagataeibacter rhaeticus TaxID=215221 RepID=A0A181CB83_9PROT|nr:16S rRNA (uracil(1498)-N(3))-methyltransferase [Komagataeibacter rhaeticus]ATU72530.1 16S rRNA (uracil(1498)-N(3))-methyltransferase [Komagataeibacter xylinus]EGG74882.1 Ribosomal RNA small subunit methyltransferase E [Gluconacetobacter sp. SXCC-1]QIP35558.1 16S rRNA (uracil(1498)-N(3))-methyltransferase [Komagataeibacter rhaeticus]QOC45312.1 16S rRNA (uracil(1498)-N(3))-methyltransferase [Komagataeibacter rhaeticus]WPP22282.1 16S rRNA (uracil(1498)-N(3))-methyltransferase [Komagataeibacter
MRDCPRLFIPPDTTAPMVAGGMLELEPGQAHYLGAVLRQQAGGEVAVFNARDGQWQGVIDHLRRERCQIRLVERTRAPEATVGLGLLFAPLKRDATETVIRMGTELGVTRFCPVVTERTNTHRLNAARLESIAREAAEQCERLDVPGIDPLVPLVNLLAQWPEGISLFAALERSAPRPMAAPAQAGDCVLIGPEGGFSAREQDMLRARAFVRPVSLGSLVLRADTAAAAALALVGAGLKAVCDAGS